MEPGHFDREDSVVGVGVAWHDLPQWSPVISTGKTRRPGVLRTVRRCRRRNGARSFRPGRHVAEQLVDAVDVGAAMEPGHFDREDQLPAEAPAPELSPPPQWSPVISTGKTSEPRIEVKWADMAAMEPGHFDREDSSRGLLRRLQGLPCRNGARSFRPGRPIRDPYSS